MKTQELNLVSSPAVARLEKLEMSGFLTLAPVAVAQRNAITRSSRNSAFCILNSSIEVAGLKTLEKPGFLTPASKVMTPPIPTPRESTTSQLRTYHARRRRGHESHYFPSRSPSPTPLMRNHHDSAASPLQNSAPCIWHYAFNGPGRSASENSALCTLHSAFNRLYLQKYIFSKPAIHNPFHTLKP
jgi:hypothetical protein